MDKSLAVISVLLVCTLGVGLVSIVPGFSQDIREPSFETVTHWSNPSPNECHRICRSTAEERAIGITKGDYAYVIRADTWHGLTPRCIYQEGVDLTAIESIVFDWTACDEHMFGSAVVQIRFGDRVIWKHGIWEGNREYDYTCHTAERIDVSSITGKDRLTLELNTTSDWAEVIFDNFRALSTGTSVLLQVPYYAAPDDALPWCAPSSLAMLLSYYGETFEHPHDVATELQTPCDELAWGNSPWWIISGAIQVGRGLTETWNDIFGTGCFSSIVFEPRILMKWLDRGDPILVCARGIAHDVVVVGYHETENSDNPILYIHDPNGYLTEGLLHRDGRIAVEVPFSAVLAQYHKQKPGRGASEALVYTCSERNPRSLSIYLSDSCVDDSKGQIAYTTSAELLCPLNTAEPPRRDDYISSSVLARKAYLFFDRGLKWRNTEESVTTEGDVLRIPCIHWSLRLYAVIANSVAKPQTTDVWIVIQSSSGDHEVIYNQKIAKVTLEAFASKQVFLGYLDWSDVGEPLPSNTTYDLFLVLRDAKTGRNIDWTRFRIRRE